MGPLVTMADVKAFVSHELAPQAIVVERPLFGVVIITDDSPSGSEARLDELERQARKWLPIHVRLEARGANEVLDAEQDLLAMNARLDKSCRAWRWIALVGWGLLLVVALWWWLA